MDVKVYGYYLSTGESIPLDDSLRWDVEQRLAGAVRHLEAGTTEVQVLAAEIIGREGRIETRCRVKAHLNRAGEPTANGTGVTVREAVMRAVHRLATVLCCAAQPRARLRAPTGTARRSGGRAHRAISL
jgi:hypothetical protein